MWGSLCLVLSVTPNDEGVPTEPEGFGGSSWAVTGAREAGGCPDWRGDCASAGLDVNIPCCAEGHGESDRLRHAGDG